MKKLIGITAMCAVTWVAAPLLAVVACSQQASHDGVLKPTPRPTHAPTPYPSETDATTGTGCGIERWAVKTGTDAGARSVNLTPQTTTIAALAAIPVPGGSANNFGNTRVSATERTVYRITATVTAYKMEADSDYHLALSDGAGHTMIAEIPKPSCVGSSSPFKQAIAAARAAWDYGFGHNAPTQYVAVNANVTLTGVGFFDRLHGQRGVAPNGIELHPVLSVSITG